MIHSHRFVENYTGLVGFGLDRETDENTVKYYLQKFSDDAVLDKIIPNLPQEELSDLFFRLSRWLKEHMTNEQYHHLFLKD